MINVVEQLTPNPVNNKHGENGCCKNPRAWEMGMMQKVKPETNADRIRAMTDEELAEKISIIAHCMYCPIRCGIFGTLEECKDMWLSWLRSPVEESKE